MLELTTAGALLMIATDELEMLEACIEAGETLDLGEADCAGAGADSDEFRPDTTEDAEGAREEMEIGTPEETVERLIDTEGAAVVTELAVGAGLATAGAGAPDGAIELIDTAMTLEELELGTCTCRRPRGPASAVVATRSARSVWKCIIW